MPDQSKERIKERINKLLALGNNESAAANEAETALRQANSLMKKHAIEMSELDTVDEIQLDGKRVSQDPSGKQLKTGRRWVGFIALGVANFTDTIASWVRSNGYLQLLFQGEVNDTECAANLQLYLSACVLSASNAFQGVGARQHNDFKMAMAGRLQERMIDIRNQRKSELREEGHSQSLVFIDNKTDRVHERFGEQQTRQGKHNNTSADIESQAREAADAVNIMSALEA